MGKQTIDEFMKTFSVHIEEWKSELLQNAERRLCAELHKGLDERIIHKILFEHDTPDTDTCPVCGYPYTTRCRCIRADSKCVNGHEWHICVIHKKIVIGSANHSMAANECSCGQEPVQ